MQADVARRPKGWQFAAFRDWHSREHRRIAYRVNPRVWTAEGLRRAEGMTEAERVQWKNCEPTLTGITFADRHVYLVLALAELDAAAVGRMLHLSYLFQRDPDFVEHHGKHQHRVILAHTASEQMIQFARGHRIRIVRLHLCRAGERPMAGRGTPDGGPGNARWRAREGPMAGQGRPDGSAWIPRPLVPESTAAGPGVHGRWSSGAPTFGRFLVQRHYVAIQLAELLNQIACFDAFQVLLCENCRGRKCEPDAPFKRELRDSHSALRYVRSLARRSAFPKTSRRRWPSSFSSRKPRVDC